MVVDTETFLETRQRISLEEQAVRNFAQGYLAGMTSGTIVTLAEVDDWVAWDKYELNFIGTDYTGAEMTDRDLLVVVYPRDWLDRLPESLFSLIIQGESK